MQSTQPEFEIVDSKNNKVILYDTYRFVVNSKTQHTVYLRCFEKCVTLHLNAEMTAIKNTLDCIPMITMKKKFEKKNFAKN